MVTVIIGNKTDTGTCRVLTLSEAADEPRYLEFPAPATGKPLTPGKPYWANYIKGVLQLKSEKGEVII